MQPLLTTTASLLVALRAGPACGLVLIQRVVRCTGRRMRPAQASVYPALKELEGKGLVRRLGPSAVRRRGRARVDYELTLVGVRVSDVARHTIRSLVAAERDDTSAAAEGMEERVRQSMALSGFVARLRRGLERREGAPR